MTVLSRTGFDEEHNAILVHLKGQPARSTRRMLNKISMAWDLPVLVFTDGDPWSYRIYASVAYGAIKSAHMSEILATPKSQFLGLQPSDIRDYNLPSDKLTDKDVEALKCGAHRSPVCHGLLEKADQPPDRYEPEVRTAGVCSPRAGFRYEEIPAGPARRYGDNLILSLPSLILSRAAVSISRSVSANDISGFHPVSEVICELSLLCEGMEGCKISAGRFTG